MPTVIAGLGDAGPSRPVPVVSALVEFGSVLHVLRDPGHHDAARWAAGVSAAMSSRLAAWTQGWWWTAQAIRAMPFVTAIPPAESFQTSLGRLRGMPRPRLARQLLRPISPSGEIRAALHWARSRDPVVTAVVDALVARPDQGAADFLRFLDHSWQEWFSAEWTAIRPILAARARVFADTVSAHGAAAALATIDTSVTVTAAGSVSIAKVQNARHDVSRRGLLVAPSTFIRPHLYVANAPRHPLLLIYPADAGPPVPSHNRLASGSLGDFCESLRDLVAHVLMWDEINLAVVTEAAAGRSLPRSGVDGTRAHPRTCARNRRSGAEGVDRAGPARVLACRDSPEPAAAGHPLGQRVHGLRQAGTEHRTIMKTRVVDEPGFAAETAALLGRLGPASPISDYPTLLADRAEPPDLALSGEPDPAVHAADLYLPARHGPVGVRWYRALSAASRRCLPAGPRPARPYGGMPGPVLSLAGLRPGH